jgi:hypothetical protein
MYVNSLLKSNIFDNPSFPYITQMAASDLAGCQLFKKDECADMMEYSGTGGGRGKKGKRHVKAAAKKETEKFDAAEWAKTARANAIREREIAKTEQIAWEAGRPAREAAEKSRIAEMKKVSDQCQMKSVVSEMRVAMTYASRVFKIGGFDMSFGRTISEWNHIIDTEDNFMEIIPMEFAKLYDDIFSFFWKYKGEFYANVEYGGEDMVMDRKLLKNYFNITKDPVSCTLYYTRDIWSKLKFSMKKRKIATIENTYVIDFSISQDPTPRAQRNGVAEFYKVKYVDVTPFRYRYFVNNVEETFQTEKMFRELTGMVYVGCRLMTVKEAKIREIVKLFSGSLSVLGAFIRSMRDMPTLINFQLMPREELHDYFLFCYEFIELKESGMPIDELKEKLISRDGWKSVPVQILDAFVVYGFPIVSWNGQPFIGESMTAEDILWNSPTFHAYRSADRVKGYVLCGEVRILGELLNVFHSAWMLHNFKNLRV